MRWRDVGLVAFRHSHDALTMGGDNGLYLAKFADLKFQKLATPEPVQVNTNLCIDLYCNQVATMEMYEAAPTAGKGEQHAEFLPEHA